MTQSFYAKGKRYCKKEEKWYNTDSYQCPNCGHRLRSKPVGRTRSHFLEKIRKIKRI